ncbi:MAG: class I SAM-dependent methyltransferase [Desulfobacteraceae bacterium]|mgnify:CR=1 FL=1|nr:MAG: class I SAM-dependent methyltransferase [Desulfobacteraceae bacterium]
MKLLSNPVSRLFKNQEQFLLTQFIQFLNNEMIPMEIVDSQGKTYSTTHKDIRHTLVVRDKRFVKALLSPDALSFGEAYINGYFEVIGNIKDLYERVSDSLLNTNRPKRFLKYLTPFFMNPKSEEQKNIEYHYDVNASFYQKFLGKTMGYTCGYYPSTDTSMDQAQNEKMDIICRKIRLKPDEQLLDIGCGWGNFAVFAAKHYQANVTGITLSQEQKEFADNWARQENVADRVKIKLMNYRDLGQKIYDKITCVGMSEHVGQRHMSGFFDRVYQCLAPDGLFLQHTITTHTGSKKTQENTFLDKYMFPGGQLLYQHELIQKAARSGFEMLSAENLRPHYVRTLQDWVRQMESKKDELLKLVSEHVYRIYHVFFIGSLVSFKKQEIALFQNLFYKKPDVGNTEDYFISLYSTKEKRLA